MRGLMLVVILAAGVAGCAGTRGAATSSPADRPPQKVEAVDCSMDRFVAEDLAKKLAKSFKAAKVWRSRARQLRDDYNDLLRRCNK